MWFQFQDDASSCCILNICRFGFAQFSLYLVLERFVEPVHINWLRFLETLIRLCSLRPYLKLESLVELCVYLPHLTVVDLVMLIQAVPSLERFVESLGYILLSAIWLYSFRFYVVWRGLYSFSYGCYFGMACRISLISPFGPSFRKACSVPHLSYFRKILVEVLKGSHLACPSVHTHTKSLLSDTY